MKSSHLKQGEGFNQPFFLKRHWKEEKAGVCEGDLARHGMGVQRIASEAEPICTTNWAVSL